MQIHDAIHTADIYATLYNHHTCVTASKTTDVFHLRQHWCSTSEQSTLCAQRHLPGRLYTQIRSLARGRHPCEPLFARVRHSLLERLSFDLTASFVTWWTHDEDSALSRKTIGRSYDGRFSASDAIKFLSFTWLNKWKRWQLALIDIPHRARGRSRVRSQAKAACGVFIQE